jgi:hypothetical protein
MAKIARHPAIDRLEDRIQATVSVSRRRYPTAILYTISASGTDVTGVSTTIPSAVEAFLRNYGLEAA